MVLSSQRNPDGRPHADFSICDVKSDMVEGAVKVYAFCRKGIMAKGSCPPPPAN